jgi:phosphate starvation-inducible PhoH-like protein
LKNIRASKKSFSHEDHHESKKKVRAAPPPQSPSIHLSPRTRNQRDYISSLSNSDVVIAEGPAGTGKTFIAATYGLKKVLEGKFERIIITRRALEADDDKIGFLPGNKDEKLYEYMRPAIDVIAKHLRIQSNLMAITSTGFVEIEHLGSLRGRTFDNTFLILDEAQNTTHKLMKMFLTRLGEGSQAVICGDITQNDLPKGKKSGLKMAIQKFEAGVEGFAVHRFTEEDVQRSKMVKRVLEVWPDEED